MLPNRSELQYFNTSQIDPDTKPVSPSMADVASRPVEVIFEPFNARPQDIFYFTIDMCRFVGRKSLSTLSIDKKITGTKDSRINAGMILGVVQRDQVTDKGIIISFRPLFAAEKLGVFQKLKNSPLTDLYFPYPFLNDDHKEDVSPVDFWNPTEEQVASLNAGEIHIRRFTERLLSTFDLNDKRIYDPACSTGQFLSSVKKAYPQAYCIGQDLNHSMAEYAQTHGCLDEVHKGSASISPVQDESVDMIFFRFLNLEVLDTRLAHELFTQIGNRCKNGGHIILLGHTPILLSLQWFEKLGLEVLQTLASDEDSVFQYYVLKKHKRIPELRYEDLNVLNYEPQVKQGSGFAGVGLFKQSSPEISAKSNVTLTSGVNSGI